MEAILKFKLPEDQGAYILASRGTDFYAFISVWYCRLRSEVKYGDHEEPIQLVYETLFGDFCSSLNEYNLSIDMVE